MITTVALYALLVPFGWAVWRLAGAVLGRREVPRPYEPRPGDPYESFAFVLWNGMDPLPARTVVMLIRQPRAR